MPGARCARSRAWCVVNTRVSHHGRTGKRPASPRNLHLRDNMYFESQIADRESIVRFRDHWLNYFRDNPSHLKQMADHFSLFDPDDPDYSNLSDGQSS
jgi:hypothetical protein